MRKAIRALLILAFALAAVTIGLPATAGIWTLGAALMFGAFAFILFALHTRRRH